MADDGSDDGMIFHIGRCSDATIEELRPEDFEESDVEESVPRPIERNVCIIGPEKTTGGPSIKHGPTYQKVLSEGYVAPVGGLLALPRELRDMIYELVVDGELPCEVFLQPFYRHVVGRFSPIPYFDLLSFPLPGNHLLACKQIFLEAGSLLRPFVKPTDEFWGVARFALPIPPEGTAEGDRQFLEDLDRRILAQLPVLHLEVMLDLQHGSKYHFSYHLGRWSLHYKSHAARGDARRGRKNLLMTDFTYDELDQVPKPLRMSGRLVQLPSFNELFYDLQGSPDVDVLSDWYDWNFPNAYHPRIDRNVADGPLTIDHIQSCVAFLRHASALQSGDPWAYMFARGSGYPLYTRKGKARVKARNRHEAKWDGTPAPIRFLSGFIDHVRSKKKKR